MYTHTHVMCGIIHALTYSRSRRQKSRLMRPAALSSFSSPRPSRRIYLPCDLHYRLGFLWICIAAAVCYANVLYTIANRPLVLLAESADRRSPARRCRRSSLALPCYCSGRWGCSPSARGPPREGAPQLCWNVLCYGVACSLHCSYSFISLMKFLLF